MKHPTIHKAAILSSAVALALCGAPLARAQDAVSLHIALKDHRFVPAELAAPANKPVVIEVTNQDPTPSEFESKTLRVEKVVAGGAKITVQIRALAPGRYRFFDDYHEDTTEGFLVVQ
jgi:heme/copper-type cytochrome/quinol oxidase subunit 2